ncbi:3-dehydroquinate dehydratase [Candidatus Nitrospira nitrosa]|uniref:3-dehydroquinate dehydratase n=1 Tax=Candidatus Nitrospira nitrosa TaxID=1742972 RepID=A0A0S4LRD3_9BACT|nr:type II 3-dehydroquinate dehydratase [Candidatus Nitrospira nitrosa]CUS39529.1 3-dehydroquinate dehydratase [Candidatus Nitrospira nitrosa]
MLRVLVLHGPNLNLLGNREQSIYGTTSLETIDSSLHKLGDELGAELVIRQSNHEGELVTWIQEARRDCQGIIINPAAYTHTSIAIRDALAAVELPTVEVHLSNIYRRETFRQQSYVSGVAVAQVSGFGPSGYLLALRGLCEYVTKSMSTDSKPAVSPAERGRTGLT